MELQWPLIIFTTFVAWASGLFAAQCVEGAKGKMPKAQLPALVAAVVILAVGGIAVMFHLQHWERIFNGFGNPTSGITQELVMVVVLVIVMVVYFAMLRRNDNAVPKPLCIAGIIVAAVLCAVMAHSYMMPSRPVWDSPLWIVAVLGNACVLGPATFALIARLVEKRGVDASANGDSAVDADAGLGKLVLGGSIVNAVTSVLYGIGMTLSAGSFVDMGYSVDPTHPGDGLPDVASAVNAFAGDYAPVFWIGVVLVGAIAPIVCALMARKKPNWLVWAPAIVVCAIVGALCLRVAFYLMGLDVFLLF